MGIWTRTVTACLVALIAAGCGIQGKSDKDAARACDSVKLLVKTRRSLDALDRKREDANRVVTSPHALRKLYLTYRDEEDAYAGLEASANAEIGKVEAGGSTTTVLRMWRQLAASLHERKIEAMYFADASAQPMPNPGVWNVGHREVVQRANAQYEEMESAMNAGLTSLGFKQHGSVFVIDC